MYYPYSENKGADQLRGYREADLRLCFRICKKPVFSRRGSFQTRYPKTVSFDNSEIKFSHHALGHTYQHQIMRLTWSQTRNIEDPAHLIIYCTIYVYRKTLKSITIFHLKSPFYLNPLKSQFMTLACLCNDYSHTCTDRECTVVPAYMRMCCITPWPTDFASNFSTVVLCSLHGSIGRREVCLGHGVLVRCL